MTKKVFVAATVLVLLTAQRVRAEVCPWAEVVGRIDSVSPTNADDTVELERSKGARSAAVPYVLLCPGDKLVVKGTATVTVHANGALQTYRAGTHAFRATQAPGLVSRLSAVKHLITSILSTPRKAIPIYATVRGPDEPAAIPQPDVLLPVGTQFLPAGYGSVAVIWDNGAGHLRVQPKSAPPFEVPTSWHAYAVFEAPTDRQSFTITLNAFPLVWHVQYTTKTPAPPPLDVVTTPAERVARALWILREGASEWHLFALSELAVLARSSFAAAELWTATRSGELGTALATVPNDSVRGR